eukprot:g25530.t1
MPSPRGTPPAPAGPSPAVPARRSRSPQGGVAAKAPTKAAKDPPDTMRVLCLHGYLQNGDVFKQKTGSLRRVLKGCECARVLSLQSLHVSGVNDVSVPRLRSEALAELYEPSQAPQQGRVEDVCRATKSTLSATVQSILTPLAPGTATAMANIPHSAVAEAADQVEAEQGQVILEEKNKKRVRYWWEEGYVPGNEKDRLAKEPAIACWSAAGGSGPPNPLGEDSDDEGCASGSETKDTECEKQPDVNALPVEGEDSDYEAVVEGLGSGRDATGRFVRWGGLHGRRCLADGDLALEERSRLRARRDRGFGGTPSSQVKPWSFCTITDNMSAQVRQVFAIEDAKRNHHLYNEEMQVLSQMAIGNYFLRQQQGFEVVQKAKEDEKLRRRSASTCALRACGETGGEVKEGSKERLPGTKQPLAVSQAWQEHQAPAASSSRVEAAPGAAPHAAPAAPKRKTLLPGSLSGGSSSSFTAREGLRKEQAPKGQVQRHFDDADFEPHVAHLKRDLTVAGGCVVPDRASMGEVTPQFHVRFIGNTSAEGHTTYVIKVTNSDGASWNVQKRYRELRELNDELKLRYPESLPQFPAKRFFGNNDPAFIASRQASLEQYLLGVLALEPEAPGLGTRARTRSPNFADLSGRRWMTQRREGSMAAGDYGGNWQVVVVDTSLELFNRAWCMAELAEAQRMGMAQSLLVQNKATLRSRRGSLEGLKVQEMTATRPEDVDAILSKIPDKEEFNRKLQELIFDENLGLLTAWTNADASQRMEEISHVSKWARISMVVEDGAQVWRQWAT